MDLSINNTELIRNKVLCFDDQYDGRYYYKFVALVRRKDYPDDQLPLVNKQGSREIVVHSWLVDCYERFDQLIPDMLRFVEAFKCRLYVTTDRKDICKTIIYAKNKLSEIIDGIALGQNDFSCKTFAKLVNSSSSMNETSDRAGRRWMFDIDSKDESIVQQVVDLCGSQYICTIPTSSGYHVLASKNFNAKRMKLPELVELKDNALTLVAKY